MLPSPDWGVLPDVRRARIGSEPKRSLISALLGIIGILLYAMAGWLYLGTGLVMPYPWVYGMWAIWVA
ncbi:MAG: hypothetical protein ACXW1Y_00955, partial [Acidimicrobiia bacterium]